MNRGTLATLRDLMPPRPLTQLEALRIAELQAVRLLAITGVKQPAVPSTVITSVPKVVVKRMPLWPASGATQWTKGTWCVIIRGNEPIGRQRFTLAHEFKHIIDYRNIDVAYPPLRSMTSRQRAEAICDYFAGCLLVPRPWLKSAWGKGIQDLRQLADLFEVSQAAIQTRLLQTGLVDRIERCENPRLTGPRTFYRFSRPLAAEMMS
jgi:Zn-dependent peptidase ImmA (M78 family)